MNQTCLTNVPRINLEALIRKLCFLGSILWPVHRFLRWEHRSCTLQHDRGFRCSVNTSPNEKHKLFSGCRSWCTTETHLRVTLQCETFKLSIYPHLFQIVFFFYYKIEKKTRHDFLLKSVLQIQFLFVSIFNKGCTIKSKFYT